MAQNPHPPPVINTEPLSCCLRAGAKPPPAPSHQHVTLHDPESKAECAAYTTNRTERKGDARQFPAQQEPRPL